MTSRVVHHEIEDGLDSERLLECFGLLGPDPRKLRDG